MKVLITGISGFAGSHLAEYIIEHHKDVELFGAQKRESSFENLAHIKNKIILVECDIQKRAQVEDVVRKILPDTIFHLAAQSYAHSSWEDPQATLSTNIMGQCNLLESIRSIQNYKPVIVIACSSEEYGFVNENEIPIRETNDLRPRSPYALSKVAQDLSGYQYYYTYGMKIIRMRAFNHTGFRRSAVFGISGFAKKIAEIEKGLREPKIEVRDLSAVRDFSDVRDIVRGYWKAGELKNFGDVYNVCSGKGITIEDMLDTLIKLSQVKNIEKVKDPHGTRPNDGGVIIGDNSKFTQASGWKSEIDFLKKTLPDMLDWWRKKI